MGGPATGSPIAAYRDDDPALGSPIAAYRHGATLASRVLEPVELPAHLPAPVPLPAPVTPLAPAPLLVPVTPVTGFPSFPRASRAHLSFPETSCLPRSRRSPGKAGPLARTRLARVRARLPWVRAAAAWPAPLPLPVSRARSTGVFSMKLITA